MSACSSKYPARTAHGKPVVKQARSSDAGAFGKTAVLTVATEKNIAPTKDRTAPYKARYAVTTTRDSEKHQAYPDDSHLSGSVTLSKMQASNTDKQE